MLGAIKDIGRHVSGDGPTPAENRRPPGKATGAGGRTAAEVVAGGAKDGAAPAPQGAALGSALHEPADQIASGGVTPGDVLPSSLDSREGGIRNSSTNSAKRERVNALAVALGAIRLSMSNG